MKLKFEGSLNINVFKLKQLGSTTQFQKCVVDKETIYQNGGEQIMTEFWFLGERSL